MEMQYFDEVYKNWYRDRSGFSPQRAKFEKRVRTVYPILTELARERELMCYSDVADQANTDRRRYLSLVLGAITRMEHQEGHPPLSVLVVQSHSRIPSEGFFELVRDLGIDDRYNSVNDQELFEDAKKDVYRFWASK